MKEVWIIKKGKLIKASKWDLFMRKLKLFQHKYKLIDTTKYNLTLRKDMNRVFTMSKKEKEQAEKIYKEKGTLSYEFYPCGGIGWGVKLHVLKTGEEIDITDINNW